MKLAKALKIKNRIIQEMNSIKEQIKSFNRYQKGSLAEMDASSLLDSLSELRNRLILIKTGIQIANKGISKELTELSELKSFLSFVDQIPCAKETTFGMSKFSLEQNKIEWESTLGVLEINKLKKEIIESISILQDVIDEYNATTEIDHKWRV